MQAAKLFLQEILINIKTRHFQSSINHREQLFHRTLITGQFRPVNIAKFLRADVLQNTSRSSRLQIFLKIGSLKSFANFTRKHLCWSLLFKNLQAEDLQFHKKRLQHRSFPVKFAKFLRTFLPPVATSVFLVAASLFFSKKYYLTAMTY